MTDVFQRTELLLGAESMQALAAARVAVFGIGGVGGHAAEALARSGVGAIDLIDNDVVSPTNLNRQIIALHSTVGMPKVKAMEARIKDINPNCAVTCHELFFSPETSGGIDFSVYDYVIDAIDSVAGKIEIVLQAKAANVPVISCMGAGNKLDPTAFTVTDITKTSVCPLARVMRRELKKRGVERLTVVYSTEPAISPQTEIENANKRPTPGSTAFVPAVCGLIAAGEVIKTLAQKK